MMSRDKIKRIYGEIICGSLWPLLDSHGYRTAASGKYVKRDNDREFRVWPGITQPSNEDVALCQIGAAVAFPNLWKLLKRSGAFGKRDMYSSAACGGRIQRMFPRELHPSWSIIGDDSDAAALGEELVIQFRTYVLPYLDTHSNLADAVSSDVCDFDRMSKAGALFLLGRREAAFQVLFERLQEVEAEFEKVQARNEAVRGWRTKVVPQEIEDLRVFRAFLEAADMKSLRQ